MGKGGNTIVKMPIKGLIEQLNKALADEWLAYYQYWIGAKVIEGAASQRIAEELEEHAKEELDHASKLVDRIVSLGGTPVLSPDEWYKKTNCGYLAPKDPSSLPIIEQNLKGERCAIAIYDKILKMTHGKDPITYHLIAEILEDEIEHEDDLERLLKTVQDVYKH